jgi:hypothetical protein
MPRRELTKPSQILAWLEDWGKRLQQPAEMILVGSAGLLWHSAMRQLDISLPEGSMDVDPITQNEELAWLCYDALIGSEFEQEHGWHVNLMPESILKELPEGWEPRSSTSQHGNLSVRVPAVGDLLAPKLKRNEPRDRAHAAWAQEHGLLDISV